MIYNNLRGSPRATARRVPRRSSEAEGCAWLFEIDRVMRERAPAGWKGDQAREAQVLNALFPLLDRDREATLALFEIVKNQPGY